MSDILATPKITREKGQRSQDVAPFLTRYVMPWSTPEWALGKHWRVAVRNQPVAMICRDTLIANINALDWKIEPRDSTQRDELKDEIKYYTLGFESQFGVDFADHVEWIGQDYLDIPFGGACEVLREGDEPGGKVLQTIPLDGTTLFPTLNKFLPVGQRVDGYVLDPVFFPAHAINRIYMSPRPEILREGWGMAPPEKIFLAMEMLRLGDKYYAQLLLDTPEAGILDLGDMEKATAEAWVQSFRELLTGVDPFKIPVLYEHNNEIKFLAFTRPPSEISYDNITVKEASFVAAGYGMSLSDIGIQAVSNGGETLAGSIRQERRTRRTGLATAKKKYVAYFNRLLPPELKFSWIDYDEELNVALGRARVASLTAFGQAIDKRIFTPKEARLQMISDGLVTISIPEDIPEEEFNLVDQANANKAPERPGLLGDPRPASTGGHGESTAGVGRAVYNDNFIGLLKKSFGKIEKADSSQIEKLIRIVAPTVYGQVKSVIENRADLVEFSEWHEIAIYDGDGSEYVKQSIDEADSALNDEKSWWDFDIDEDEIVGILSAAYLMALRSAAEQISLDAFSSGYSDEPIPLEPFFLTNSFVLSQLQKRAAQLVQHINDGTKYYLKRMIISQVRKGLTQPEIVNLIAEGVDINEILRDNEFIQEILQSVRSDIEDLTDLRIRRIVSYEVGSVQNKAWLDEFSRVGLTKKNWVHDGPDDPCEEYCQPNIDVGFVPLDYQYTSAFGPVEGPLAHPEGHCHLGYDREELRNLAMRGTFNIWTGD